MMVLLLDVAGRRCAVPQAQVEAVLQSVAVTELPDAPQHVAGVVDVHGTLVPVVSLRRVVGAPERPMQLDDHLVHTRSGACELLLWVDRAVDLSQLAEPPRVDGETPLENMAALPDGVLLVHDVGKLLTAREASTLAAALSARRA